MAQEKKTASPPAESLQCSVTGTASEMNRSHGNERTPDNINCFIDLARTREILKSPLAVAIDLRSREAFSRGHLAESLNLAAADIKTKGFLSNRALLIYGSGKSDGSFRELCQDLRKRGFRNIGILPGGFALLAKAGLVPSFDSSESRRLSELTSAELFAELSSTESLILNVSASFKVAPLGAKYLRMDPPLDEDRVSQLLDRELRASQKTSFKRIVLVGTTEIDPSRILNLMQSSKIDYPVFEYPRDIGTYEQSIRELSLLWSRKDKGPTVRKCGVS